MTTLEKIRAEIEQHKNDKFNCIGVNDVLKIIDKYAEQEPTIPCDLCGFNTGETIVFCEYLSECPAIGKGGE